MTLHRVSGVRLAGLASAVPARTADVSVSGDEFRSK